MKKILTAILALTIMLTAIGCANKPEETSANLLSDKTVSEIIDAVYAHNPVEELPLMTMELDLSDIDGLNYHTGLTSADGLKSAAISESMIGAQAYSMVVVRANDKQTASKIAEEMKNNINTSKWVCVTADDLAVTSFEDVVFLFMIGSQHADITTSAEMIAAFNAVCEGKTPEVNVNTETNEDEIDNGEDIEADADADASEPSDDEAVEDELTDAPAADENIEAEPEVPADDETVEAEPEAPADDETVEAAPEAPAENADLSSKTLPEIIELVYANKPVDEIMLMTMELDLTNTDMLKYNTGLDSAENIKEAAISEPMIGAIGYSLVLVRANDAETAKTVAEEMKSGIDTRKWVCAEADDLSVAVYEDLVFLFMVDSEHASVVTSAEMIAAFNAVFGL